MKVYGITEIARALDTDPGLVGKWRERHKLPAPDAELATGPVWLADTIEPLLAAGGPEPSDSRPATAQVPGHRPHDRRTVPGLDQRSPVVFPGGNRRHPPGW